MFWVAIGKANGAQKQRGLPRIALSDARRVVSMPSDILILEPIFAERKDSVTTSVGRVCDAVMKILEARREMRNWRPKEMVNKMQVMMGNEDDQWN